MSLIKFLLVAVAMAATAAVAAAADSLSIGDGLWRTFGHQTELPTTEAAAVAAGWQKVSDCETALGVLYSQDAAGPSEKHPLSLRFTARGQIAGVQATVFGSNKVSDAAPDNLVKLGYWKISSEKQQQQWKMDVSFRAAAVMCETAETAAVTESEQQLLGERVVINQDTIAHAIPLTAAAAREALWTQGSCMSSMGQHHFYDLSAAPLQSYDEQQLLPLVPMYNPPDSTGSLHAFFFASPVSQPGSQLRYLLTGAADWESPALVQKLMCQNWCDDDNCAFDTPSWATMHIYLNSAWKSLECPNGSGPVGRSCDL